MRRMNGLVGFILGLLLMASGGAGCAMNAAKSNTFYVATKGNDSAVGSEAQPFASLPRALAAVRELRGKERGREATILLRGGTYFLSAPITIMPRDSGTDRAVLTIAAYKDE